MKDKLRELAGEMRNELCSDFAQKLEAILDAEGDVGAVDSIRALLIEALTGYRCNRTVDEYGEPLPLVDVLSPGEGGTIQSGTDEIEYLAEYLADELPNPPAQAAQADGWQKLTDAVRDMQAKHLGNHQGDVYHAMQYIGSKYGKPETRPLIQPITAPEPVVQGEAIHVNAVDGDGATLFVYPPIAKRGDTLYTAQPRAVPDGWVLVPLEPTDAMCASIEYGAASHICETRKSERMYFLRKAIAAAPSPGESE